MSSDYHVVYIDIGTDEDRLEVAVRIERECDREAAEGWYLDETINDMVNGDTRGVWLVFTAEETSEQSDVIAEAEEIILEGGEQGF